MALDRGSRPCGGLTGRRKRLPLFPLRLREYGGQNGGSSVLDRFKALSQHLCVAIVERDVIGGRGAHLQTDRLADHESDRLGLQFTDRPGCGGSTVAAVQELVRLCSAESYVAWQRRTQQRCSWVSLLTQPK